MRTERVGFALCGSFCTHEKALAALKRLTEEYETVIPIVSENAAFTVRGSERPTHCWSSWRN